MSATNSLSGRGIQLPSRGEDRVPEHFTERALRDKIDAPADHCLEFLFQLTKADESDPRIWLEFDQQIDVAVRGEIIPQHRAEHGKFTNRVAPADLSDCLDSEIDLCRRNDGLDHFSLSSVTLDQFVQ